MPGSRHWDLTRDITLVIHDWGSALGFHRATAFIPAQIRAIAYMEAIAMADAVGRFLVRRPTFFRAFAFRSW